MVNTFHILAKRVILILLFLFTLCGFTIIAQNTTVFGTVTDSVSGEAIPYATVSFENSTIGKLTDEAGKFRLSNNQQKSTVVVTFMGYETKRIEVPVGKETELNIPLSLVGVNITEVVVNPGGKEKYSKKNNPAVELIKKVIEHKNDYTINNQDYYKYEEYDRIVFALNDFDPTQKQFSKFQYLDKYTSKSRISDKAILPLSLRETLSDVFYKKKNNDTKKVVRAYNNKGLDQNIDTESMDAVIAETFQDINIRENNIYLLQRDFVSPLSSHSAVNFYKWYIVDTIEIEQKRYIELSFVPFNTRDVGFSGSLYIANDSTYAIKKLWMQVPTKSNINFVEDMIIEQEFEQLSPTLWIPKEFTTAMELSFYYTIQAYVEKVKTFDKFNFQEVSENIFDNPAPEIYLPGYNKHDKEFWDKHRPQAFNQDFHVDLMMDELLSNKFIHIALEVANIFATGYVPTNRDLEKNKFDIGTTLTFYSYNYVEGNRFRLTGATTKNFHPHLFLYGYGAYGTHDRRWKYMTELTWAFNEPKYHKDEFPKNNLSVAYKYDINALGQRFLQAERDNIFMSSTKKNEKLTYDRMSEVSYIKEYYNGFSFNVKGITHNETPAGKLVFQVKDEFSNIVDTIRDLKTTELNLTLRYAPNEAIMQQRRERRTLPSRSPEFNLSYTAGLKDVLGSDHSYHKVSLTVSKQFWIAPFGRIRTLVQGEKVWGKVPFPLLLAPNANNSFTVQRGSFYLLEPLEFVNDALVSWHIDYRPGGWLFNRIPVIKNWRWREIVGFRGFIGGLSKKNNPIYNRNMMEFPETSYTMGKTPYMEYTVGIDNIFQFLRIDYVRRLNYLDHSNIDKDGIRISFEMRF